MKLKPFFRMLTVEQLERVADATAWNHCVAEQDFVGGYLGGDFYGCLICHASGNYYGELADLTSIHFGAEMRYMRYAQRHGDAKAGALMAYMARHELARRKLQALTSEQQSVAEINAETDRGLLEDYGPESLERVKRIAEQPISVHVNESIQE